MLEDAACSRRRKGGMNMRERFSRFMAGRHGSDEFSQFLSYVALACMLLALVFRKGYWNIIILALLIVCYYRIFSKNHQKRYEENQKFLAARARFLSWFQKEKYLLGQRKDYRIYTCPGCKQKIRIPKGKGKIVVKCPKCHTEFTKKS